MLTGSENSMDKPPNKHFPTKVFGNQILKSGIDTEDITSQIMPQVAQFLEIIKRKDTSQDRNRRNLRTTKGKIEC
jgi:hypothetical protein